MKSTNYRTRALLLLVVTLLFCVGVFADDIVSQTATITNKKTITIDGISYKVLIDVQHDGEDVAFKGGDTYYWVDEDDCGLFNRSRVCVDDTTNTSGTWVADITVYSPSANINYTFSISDDDLFEGEESTITASVTNNGNNKAENLTIGLSLPKGVVITESERFLHNETDAWFNNDFDEGETATFSITFKLTSAGTYSFMPYLWYHDIYGYRTQPSFTAIPVDSEAFCDYNYTIAANKIGVDENSNLTINIINQNYTNITIEDLRVNVPPILEAYERNRLKEKRSDLYTYDGTIGKNVTKTLELYFKGRRGGQDTLNISFECRQTGSEIVSEVSLRPLMEVFEKNLVINSNLLDQEYAESGTDKRFEVNVFNPYSGQAVIVKQINITVDNTVSAFPITNVIPAQKTKNIVNTTLRMPNVQEGRDINIHLLVNYETQLGDEFTFEKNYTISVYTFSLDVIQVVDRLTLPEGESTTVSVIIDNKNDRGFDQISVYDISDLITAYSPNATFELPAYTKKTVYNYTVLAPFVEEKTEFPIRTFVEAELDGNTRIYRAQNTVNVVPAVASAATSSSNTTTKSNVSQLQLLANEESDTNVSESSSIVISDDIVEQSAVSVFFESTTFYLVVCGLLVVVLILGIFAGRSGFLQSLRGSKGIIRRQGDIKKSFHPPLDEVHSAINRAKGIAPPAQEPIATSAEQPVQSTQLPEQTSLQPPPSAHVPPAESAPQPAPQPTPPASTSEDALAPPQQPSPPTPQPAPTQQDPVESALAKLEAAKK